MTHSTTAPDRKGSTTMRRLARFPKALLFLSAFGLLLLATETRAGIYIRGPVVVRRPFVVARPVVPVRPIIVAPRRLAPVYVAPRVVRPRVYYPR